MSAHRRPTLISRSARPKRAPAQPVQSASALDDGDLATLSPDTDAQAVTPSYDSVDTHEATVADGIADADGDIAGGVEVQTLGDASSATASPSSTPDRGDESPESDRSGIEETDLYGAFAPPDHAQSSPIPASGDAATVEADDYADYLRSVEEAAARSRAQQRRKRAAVVPATSAVAAVPVAQAATGKVSQSTAAMDGAAVVAEGVVGPPRARRSGPPNGRRPGGPSGPRGPRGRAMARREPDPRPRWRRPKTWFITFATLVGLATATIGGYAAYVGWVAVDAFDKINEPLPNTPVIFTINPEGTPVPLPPEEAEQQLPNWNNKDPFNILLLGIDERPGDDEPPRSDTMIVVRVYPDTRKVTMMSIPRDLWVTIPGYQDDKINAAYPLAELDESDSGPGLVMETISYNFGIRLHYYMTIDFDGFREVVNTLGGVIIDVRSPIKDDLYPTEDFGVTREYFPTGLQKMDGETALRFARTRHGDNDIARGDRQQQVLTAIREQATVGELFTQATDLIRDFEDTVRTDLNFNQLLALANLGRSVETNEIVKVNLWEAGVLFEHTPEFEGDAFYMDADWSTVYDLMDTYFLSDTAGPPLPTPDPDDMDASQGTIESGLDLSIPVIIQNASGYAGVAPAAMAVMENAGFWSVTRDGTEEYSDVTVIYDYAESPATAQYIAAQLGLDESSIVYGSGGNGIVVMVGDDVGAGLVE